MLLAKPDDLIREINDVIRPVPVLDEEGRQYVAGVLAFPLSHSVEEIRLNHIAAYNPEVAENPQLKLMHFAEMSDRCLCAGAFYLDELEKDKALDEVGLMRLGKAGYRAAAVHAPEDAGNVYQRLAEAFHQIVAYVNPLMIKYLGGKEIPRLVFWTPEGERIFKAGYSSN
jgi:hypothetical protein